MPTVELEVTATALNLRSAPGMHGRVVAVLIGGQRVAATPPASDGWIAVTANGVSGYCAERLLRQVGVGATAPAAAPVDVAVKDRDLSKLHPTLRATVNALLEGFATSELPFRVFEGFRAPERQEWLFAQGRTRPGGIVTKAQAWESHHQYGLAVDLVLFDNGAWSWDDRGANASLWHRMRDAAKAAGLRVLDWEMPHAELAVALSDLRAGKLPGGGDASWQDNLEAAVTRWTRSGKSGSPTIVSPERPPLEPSGSAT